MVYKLKKILVAIVFCGILFQIIGLFQRELFFVLISCNFTFKKIVTGMVDGLSSRDRFFTISAAQRSEVVAVEESSCDADGQQLSSLQLSPHIRCLVFPRGDITRFKPAR